MRLVGPWLSGFTRRVGITLKLLDIPFEHLPFHAYLQKEEVRRYNPMGKVPALVLDDGEIVFDSGSIIDHLYEMVGSERALLSPSGAARRQALRLSAIGDAVYNKLTGVLLESMRPPSLRVHEISDEFMEQALTGLGLIEQEAGEGWLVANRLGHADVMTVVSYQTAQFVMPEKVTASDLPKLDALTQRAMRIDAFSSTAPSQ